MNKLIILFALTLIISPAYLLAQMEDTEAKIRKLPQVTYPSEASITGLDGEVRVVVDVDEKGKVSKAYDATGPGWVCDNNMRPDVVAMRQIAAKAAERASFVPATSGGKPISSQLQLTFNFKNPNPRKTGSSLAGVAYGEDSAQADSSSQNTPTRLAIIGSKNTDVTSESAKVFPPKSSTASADTKTVSGGILNGKAIALPKPTYPAVARAIKASGAVQMQVLIDTNGTVLIAEPISGHPLLRGASRIAACGAKFLPTLLSGKPVLVSGRITYNFSL